MSFGSAGSVKRRSPTLAGIFYPEDPKAAEAVLRAFESGSRQLRPPTGDAALALIVPHAGWDLSGRVTSDAFAAASGRKVSTVVIVGPIHENSLHGSALHKRSLQRSEEEGLFLSESEYFETPIGDLPVDRELCGELESCGTFFFINDSPHLAEHSIEILLPFVKRTFPSAAIVPVLVGGNRAPIVTTLARGLDLVFGPIADSTLFVVSTNLCAKIAAQTANEHADRFAACLSAGEPELILDGLANGTISACGAAGCAALLETVFLGGGKAVPLSASDSSGRPEHDPLKLVRYGSFAFY